MDVDRLRSVSSTSIIYFGGELLYSIVACSERSVVRPLTLLEFLECVGTDQNGLAKFVEAYALRRGLRVVAYNGRCRRSTCAWPSPTRTSPTAVSSSTRDFIVVVVTLCFGTALGTFTDRIRYHFLRHPRAHLAKNWTRSMMGTRHHSSRSPLRNSSSNPNLPLSPSPHLLP